VQIYCDFSGYSDMAVGLARILGYDLTINFRQPYSARTVAEFWQKWHISLSSWFRDYLYIPLGGNRVAPLKWGMIVLIVFLTSGLWHGASWTFVAWGALHGMYVICGALTRKFRANVAVLAGLARFPRVHAIEKVLVTDSLVALAWVFFRANGVPDALYILSHMWRLTGFDSENLFQAGLPRFEMAFLPFALSLVFCGEYFRLHRPPRLRQAWSRRPVRWLVYASGIYGVVFFGIFQHIEFIYFQF
jgi:D-alanyl-lipoteichoic acid acyltransferase DltB (MBOAT superfamily)